MDRKSIIPVVATIVAASVLLTACDSTSPTESVVVEEDIFLKDGSVITEWIVEDVVPIPAHKPAVMVEKRPSPWHIWLPGEWQRTDGSWHWQDGRWRKPPTKNAHWMAGHWRMDSDKWHWSPGHWTVSNRLQHFTSPVVAPALLPEERPAKPSEHNHWLAGYWDWDGHWYWIPGYWTSKPNPDAEWIAGHWDEFGSADGYRWIGGHWRIKS